MVPENRRIALKDHLEAISDSILKRKIIYILNIEKMDLPNAEKMRRIKSIIEQ